MSGDGARRAAGAEREEFVGFFPQVVRDLTGDGLGHPEVGGAVARLKEVRTGGPGEVRGGPGWVLGRSRGGSRGVPVRPAWVPVRSRFGCPERVPGGVPGGSW